MAIEQDSRLQYQRELNTLSDLIIYFTEFRGGTGTVEALNSLLISIKGVVYVMYLTLLLKGIGKLLVSDG